MSIASADLTPEPPRFRITGTVPATDKEGVYMPSYNFVTYDVGWTEEQALVTLDLMASALPPGSNLELQSTRDQWVRVEGGWRSVKKPEPVLPRKIKDRPQA